MQEGGLTPVPSSVVGAYNVWVADYFLCHRPNRLRRGVTGQLPSPAKSLLIGWTFSERVPLVK